MSKRRPDSFKIHNPDHYFNRYIAMEVRKDKICQRKYNDFFCSLEEKLSERSSSTQRALAVNLDGTDLERNLLERDLLSWIDYIESPALFLAIEQLNTWQQYLLTYRFYLSLSQRETAQLLGCSQSTVQRCEQRLVQKLKESLSF